jgi:hypothetical protein
VRITVKVCSRYPLGFVINSEEYQLDCWLGFVTTCSSEQVVKFLLISRNLVEKFEV